jgi:hypothetical protein
MIRNFNQVQRAVPAELYWKPAEHVRLAIAR